MASIFLGTMYQKKSELETTPFLPPDDVMPNPSRGRDDDIMISRQLNGDGRVSGCPGPPMIGSSIRGVENSTNSVKSAMQSPSLHLPSGLVQGRPSIQRSLRPVFNPIQKIFTGVWTLLSCRSTTQRYINRKFCFLLVCCIIVSTSLYFYERNATTSHQVVSESLVQPRYRDLMLSRNYCALDSISSTGDNKGKYKYTGINEVNTIATKTRVAADGKDNENIDSHYPQISPQKYQTRSPARVLLICKTSLSIRCQLVQEKLEFHRIPFKVSVAGKNIPDLIKSSKGKGKYVTIIFEEYQDYLSIDKWNREILDKYCRTFDAGIVAFVAPQPLNPTSSSSQNINSKTSHLIDLYGNNTGRLPITLNSRSGLDEFSVSDSSNMFRILKGGQTAFDKRPIGHWLTFSVENTKNGGKNYWPVLLARDTQKKESTKEATVLQDFGYRDGITKVLFGVRRIPNDSSGIKTKPGKAGGERRKKSDLKKQSLHWIQHVLFLDALWWTSKTKIQLPLSRYMMIDIDDIFTGKNRLRVDEVKAMRESQHRISQMYKGLSEFKYNLGFSGGTFKKGPDSANKIADDNGDEALLKYRKEFSWFPHEWQHRQPHEQDNTTVLSNRMSLNKRFALDHGMAVNNGYAVSPHHSGVFPVHEPLYDAWKNVWNISVTSTEEYPHLNPKRSNIRLPRRGFIHRRTGIKVLPRQTCGLFTKNLYYSEYPNGPEVLESSIQGGELFQVFVNNPVSIFMTHMPNYAFDRLAPYTFESVLSMLKCWTNLEVKTAKPKELGEIYFELFPDEKIPMWSNPCEDKRHEEIWSASKTCQRLPDFLVIGPQKTGTTALYKFLQIHPSIKSNIPSPTTFEEPQFFSNNKNYEMGIDWYMRFFPSRELDNGENDTKLIESKSNIDDSSAYEEAEDSETLLFEKSATYFDREVVPERAYELLPDALLITIIISPAKRAHSWYQHQRAHGDETALKYSFYEVITANTADSPKALKSLQTRCLEPGKYASHIERWLQFYGPQQIYIVDGEQLLNDPILIMNSLQHFLSVKPLIDYKDHLGYDEDKGYFCPVVGKCLGPGKGRKYNHTIDAQSKKFLQDYYRLSNEALLKLLNNRLGYDIPTWLRNDLNESPENEENEDHDDVDDP